MAETVDNTLLASLLRDIRKEQTEQRTLLLSVVDHVRKMEQRLDARIMGVRDDLELVLKSELLGSLTNFETRIEQRLAELESR
jgi:hypothetical protein